MMSAAARMTANKTSKAVSGMYCQQHHDAVLGASSNSFVYYASSSAMQQGTHDSCVVSSTVTTAPSSSDTGSQCFGSNSNVWWRGSQQLHVARMLTTIAPIRPHIASWGLRCHHYACCVSYICHITYNSQHAYIQPGCTTVARTAVVVRKQIGCKTTTNQRLLVRPPSSGRINGCRFVLFYSLLASVALHLLASLSSRSGGEKCIEAQNCIALLTLVSISAACMLIGRRRHKQYSVSWHTARLYDAI
jgi:hypothetical protein